VRVRVRGRGRVRVGVGVNDDAFLRLAACTQAGLLVINPGP
jgi:hypothetical protein